MGGPMCANLLKSGCRVYAMDAAEKSLERAAAAGAVKATPDMIGENADAVFLSLPNGGIVKDVLFGENGLARHLKKGTVVADTSSITPIEAKACFEALEKLGVDYVDCPVSGGEPGAVKGTLAFMAGGTEEAFHKLGPYFEILGSSAVRIGPSGSGSVAKLANQVIVNAGIAAVSEAFTLAVKCGADPEKVFLAIRGGLAGSAVLEAKVPMMIAHDFKPGGSLTINRKDIKNVLDTAHSVDVPMFLTSQLFEIMQALKVSGHMGDDHSGIVQFYEQMADVSVEKKSE